MSNRRANWPEHWSLEKVAKGHAVFIRVPNAPPLVLVPPMATEEEAVRVADLLAKNPQVVATMQRLIHLVSGLLNDGDVEELLQVRRLITLAFDTKNELAVLIVKKIDEELAVRQMRN